MNIVDFNNVTKSYFINKNKGYQRILEDVTFSIRKGTITGVIGDNGSGKSTTLKIILGLVRPDNGKVRTLTKQVSYLPEKTNLYKNLTGKEYLNYLKEISKEVIKNEKLDTLIEDFLLKDKMESKISTYSKGTIQKLGFVGAFLSKASLIILDEPFSGVDNDSKEVMKKTISDFSNSERNILIASHQLEDLRNICDQFIHVKDSKCIFEENENK